MWAKTQRQMEVLNPIYMEPNITTLTQMKILNTHFALSNET